MADDTLYIEYMPLDDLLTRFHPENPKAHDIGALIISMGEFGYVSPGAIDEKTGLFIEGHGRTETLAVMRKQQMDAPYRIRQQNGHWLVPVVRGITFENSYQVKAYLVGGNQLSAIGGWDKDALASILQDLARNSESLMNATGFDGDDLDNILFDLAHTTDAGYAVDQKMLNKWRPDNEAGLNETDQDIYLPEHILIERKPEKRKIVASKQRKELTEIMRGLPNPDTDYYIITVGRGKKKGHDDIVRSFGFGNFIDYVTAEFGNGCIVFISTWSMNIDHAFMLLELLESGRIGELHILCDPNFTERKTDIFLMLKSGMDKFPKCRWLGFKNHSKVLCISNADSNRFCTVTGSSNLSGLPRSENYTVSTSPEMYHTFVSDFFEVMFNLDVTKVTV